jgi:hypothetical protein
MKRNKVFILLLMALPTLVMTSCLKDQEDTFDKASSLRMQDYLDKARATILDAQYGWVFEYYPESEQLYGGFTYTLEFDSKMVKVRSELSDDAESSYYSMKSDMGPVLSFDTYNEQMHFFATPNAQRYQGYKGDFEFVIDSIGQDVIKVHGKRVHGKKELPQNTMYLRKLTMPAEDYMNKVKAQAENFFLATANGSVQSKYDIDDRQATFSVNGQEITRAYTFTDGGIRLYSPITVNGKQVSNFAYNDASLQLNCLDEGATDIQLKGDVVKDYLLRVLGLSSTTLALGDAEAVNRKLATHHDIYTFETTADWLTIGTEGQYIVMTVKENASGHMRSGTLYYTRNGVKDSITVAQCEFDKDIAGVYQLRSLVDEKVSIPAVFRQNSKGGYEFGLTVQGQELIIPVTYDAGSAHFHFECAKFWGKGDFTIVRSGVEYTGTYYAYPIFLYGNGAYWTAYAGGYYYNGDIEYDPELDATVAVLYGKRSSTYNFESLAICAFNQESIEATTFAGYIDEIDYPYFIK